MHSKRYRGSAQLGFTLVELAIVLVVVGLLITGLLTPLGVQRDIRDYSETRAELAEIRESLIGYALSHIATDGRPYMPCPDTSGDGLENRAAGACLQSSGDFPWQTLGLGRLDSWNNSYLYRVSPSYSNSSTGFTLASVGNNVIVNTVAVGGANVAAAIPVVVVSKGKNGSGTSADEAENADGDITFVRKEQIDVAANAFDDIVVWVPATILASRMVTAGLLP